MMKLEIEITRQDYLNFNLYEFKKRRLVSTIVTGLVGLLILQYFLNKDEAILNMTAIIASSFLYITLFGIFMYLQLNRSKSIPKDDGSFLGKKEYEFLDDHITFKDKDSEGSLQWHAIKSLEENNKAFYLYVDTVMAIVIPKRYFINKTEEQNFRSYVKSKLTVV